VHFNVIQRDFGFKADFYTSGRDELHTWAFRHARQMEYRGEPVNVALPEYIIVRKLEYFREGGSDKHLRDIRTMLAVSGAQLNGVEPDAWIRRRGLEGEWKIVVDEPEGSTDEQEDTSLCNQAGFPGVAGLVK
jgi:hypothetical protein